MDVAVCNFPVISVLDRARGAALFAVDCVRQRTLTGETAVVARLAVAVKRKIQARTERKNSWSCTLIGNEAREDSKKRE